LVMTITGAGERGDRVIDACNYVDIVTEAGERGETGRHDVVASHAFGNPVTLRNTVAVEPEDKTGLDRGAGGFSSSGFRSVSRTARVEHRDQRRQADANRGSSESRSF